jgi:predicted unusual protein kinase regulating ubiquinone biosynthesis (AarF/ABC1/UbiB family)
MVTYRSLAELEDAQDQARRTARLRIELAEQYIGHYRFRIEQVGETFHSLGAHEGVVDDPGFREELRRVSDTADENIAYAGRKIGELDDEYDAMLREQDEQQGRLLAEHHNTD